MFHKTVILIALLIISSGLANAQAPDRSDDNSLVTINDYLRVAASNNAELKASFQQWRSTVEQISQARTLPDPKFNYQLETRRSPNGQTFGIMQSLPWFGVIEARTDAAGAAAKAARKRYDTARLRIFSDLKQAYFEYSFLAQQIQTSKQNLELLMHFEEISRLRYATAMANHPDHIRAEIEIENARYELDKLQRSQAPAVSRLLAMLNFPAERELPWPEPALFSDVNLPAPRIHQLVLKNNPEIDAMEYEIAAARSQVALAQKRRAPEFDIGFDAMYRSEATMGPGDDPFYLKAGVSLPIWTNSYSAGERQARANVRAANYQKQQLENRLVAQADRVLFEIGDAARRVRLYAEVLGPRAEEMLASYESLYRGGQADFLTLIDAQRRLLEIRLQKDRAINEHAQKLAELEMLTGGSYK